MARVKLIREIHKHFMICCFIFSLSSFSFLHHNIITDHQVHPQSVSQISAHRTSAVLAHNGLQMNVKCLIMCPVTWCWSQREIYSPAILICRTNPCVCSHLCPRSPARGEHPCPGDPDHPGHPTGCIDRV